MKHPEGAVLNIGKSLHFAAGFHFLPCDVYSNYSHKCEHLNSKHVY